MSVDRGRDHLQRLVTCIFALLSVATNSLEDKHVCLTPACKKISQTILSNMDSSVDPCENMYQYACGGWHKKLDPSSKMEFRTRFIQMNEENEIQTRKILEDSNFTIKGRHSEAILKAQTLYKNCMDEKTIEEKAVKDLIKQINRLGSWTVVQSCDFEPWQRTEWTFSKMVTAIHKVFPMSSFWNFLSISSLKDANDTSLVLEQGPLTFKVTKYSDNIEDKYAYLEYAAVMAALLGGIYEIVQDKMKDVFALEKRLAEISVKDLYLIGPFDMKYIKFSDFQSRFGDLINWQEYLSQRFSRKLLSGNGEILLRTPEYFDKVADIIRETDNEVLANFMIWMVIHKSLSFLPKIFYEKAKQHFVSRDKFCHAITNTFMAPITYAMLVQKNYNDSTGDTVTSVLLEVKHQFLVNLNNVTWLDEETRAAIRDKADNVGMLVGHPDWMGDAAKLDERYEDLHIKQGDFFDNHLQINQYDLTVISKAYNKKPDIKEWPDLPTRVNAEFNHFKNAMVFPALILKYPVFSTDYPKPYYYGSFGVLCGHEFTHGFDSLGRMFTKFGTPSQNWWTNSSVESFENKSACFVDFYGKYELQGTKFNSIKTLREDIADSGGIRSAYKAFKASQQDNDFTLPGINLTADQMFFLGFGQHHCCYYSSRYQKHIAATSSHTISSHRLLGTLSNSREFAEAYGCKTNSKMNPSEKCEIW